MRFLANRTIGFALVLIVALTGQAMAVARAAPGPTGQIVLCSGSGPVMVYVDADGAPVGAPHICPDYALSLILQVDMPDLMPHRVDVVRRQPAVRAELQNTDLPQPRMVARAPPRAL